MAVSETTARTEASAGPVDSGPPEPRRQLAAQARPLEAPPPLPLPDNGEAPQPPVPQPPPPFPDNAEAPPPPAAPPATPLPDNAGAPPPRRFSILPVPTLGYSPETRFYAGAVALMTLRPFAAPHTRTSNLKIEVAGTQNRQLLLQSEWQIFFPGDRYVLASEIAFQKYPENFYGIGPDTPASAEELYDARRIELEVSPRMQVRPHWFVGPGYRLQSMFGIEAAPGGALASSQASGADGGSASSQVPGADGGLSSGLGYQVMWDTRDNVLNPSGGRGYLSLSHLFFGRAVGSDFSFSRLEIDARAYLKTHDRHVLALQAFGQFHTGTPPFRMLGLLGGDMITRGYYYGRYRDRQLLALQAEYRMPVYWRIGLVAFAGVGEVAGRLSGFTFSALKPTAGGGLRLLVDKRENINLRIDFAVGRGSSGFYFSFGEAF